MFKHRCPRWWFHAWSVWGDPHKGKAYDSYGNAYDVLLQTRRCERCGCAQVRKLRAGS